MAAAGGEIDFVRDIAVHYPLLVVMSVLGVPPEDEPMMLRLTQQYFGNNDAELARRGTMTPEEVDPRADGDHRRGQRLLPRHHRGPAPQPRPMTSPA